MNRKLIDNCLKIIDYITVADLADRTVNDISFNTRLSYVQIRNCIKMHFPQCFEQNMFNGWNFTGEPLLLDPLIEWEKKPEQPQQQTYTRQGHWEWRKEHLDALDALFGRPLAEVLVDFQKKDKLSDLSGVGKTLARAADQMAKTGKVPF